MIRVAMSITVDPVQRPQFGRGCYGVMGPYAVLVLFVAFGGLVITSSNLGFPPRFRIASMHAFTRIRQRECLPCLPGSCLQRIKLLTPWRNCRRPTDCGS
jgi:hypothetical protein